MYYIMLKKVKMLLNLKSPSLNKGLDYSGIVKQNNGCVFTLKIECCYSSSRRNENSL